MKKIIIGILGGMSAQSTAKAYLEMNSLIPQYCWPNGYFPEILIYSVDFGVIERFQEYGEWGKAEDYLASAVNGYLSKADFIVMCTNTMHKILPGLEAKTGKEFVSIVEATAERARDANYQKVLILGTRFVMEEDFYKSGFEALGIEAVAPNLPQDQAYINETIFKRLVNGEFLEEDQEKFWDIIRWNHEEQGIEAAVMACTEIPLLMASLATFVPLLDTMAIQVEAAVKKALAKAWASTK